MRAIVGHSDDPDTGEALDELLGQLHGRLGGETPNAAMLFCSVE